MVSDAKSGFNYNPNFFCSAKGDRKTYTNLKYVSLVYFI